MKYQSVSCLATALLVWMFVGSSSGQGLPPANLTPGQSWIQPLAKNSMILISTSTVRPNSKPQPKSKEQSWRKSWPDFAQRLSTLISEEVSLSDLKTASKGDNLPAISPKSVKEEFEDVGVEWEGVVQQIFPPENTGCMLAMKPTPIKFKDGSQLVLDSLKLFPLGENVKSWKSVKVGDTVLFHTTLKGNAMLGVVVIMHTEGGFDKNLYGNGVSTGDTLIMISTEDAELFKVKTGKEKKVDQTSEAK
jgi:hypothetical protein